MNINYDRIAFGIVMLGVACYLGLMVAVLIAIGL
jgi:hypothetical protein